MKHCTSLSDITDVQQVIDQAIAIKQHQNSAPIGKGKTLGLLFYNPSLRTRLSTQKAARMLGIEVIVMNINKEGWTLEFEEGAYMNHQTSEHIKEAAGVLSCYCDIIGIRIFPLFHSKSEDEQELVLNSFKKYCSIPVINLESATAHPLQGLTDAMTIQEFKIEQPKIVMTWAPHPSVLPQAVPNSFSEVMNQLSMKHSICNPSTHNLAPHIVQSTPVFNDQVEALKDADIVYVKNWGSNTYYGEKFPIDKEWTFTLAKWQLTNQAKVLHCLPVRRNVVIEDAILDGSQSAVLNQAENRTYIAASILTELLQANL